LNSVFLSHNKLTRLYSFTEDTKSVSILYCKINVKFPQNKQNPFNSNYLPPVGRSRHSRLSLVTQTTCPFIYLQQSSDI